MPPHFDNMEDKKLFLLDAYALIYRAYYALIRSPRFTAKGLDTSAIFGFCNTLDELLRKENPTHIAVCFDPKGGDTFRHEAYPEYKANRDAQPEGITAAIPYIKSILAAYNIPVIEMPRYEADDIIGTLSRQAQAEGFTTYMMTPDKDYGQLVTDKVFMYRPALKQQGFEVRGPKEVCERYGIERPEQMIDLLALEGDAVDNIPGCPGVGEKTAARLIKEWGSVENLLENTASLKGALQKRVVENADRIRFSKFLATIKTDVPLTVDFDELRRRPENIAALLELFNELEFKTLARRISESSAAQNAETASAVSSTPAREPSLFDFDAAAAPRIVSLDPEARYSREADAAGVERLVERACRRDAIGVALYAPGADAMTSRLRGVAVAVDRGEAVYIELPPEGAARDEMKSILSPLWSSSAVVVSHDVKRDYIILKNEGMPLRSAFFDTSVAHYLLQPEMRHGLSDVAAAYLGYHTLGYDVADRERHSSGSLGSDEAMSRFCEEADVVLRLRGVLMAELDKGGLLSLLRDIELPLVPVLAEMEWTGVRIDVEELNTLSRSLTQRMRGMEREVYDLAGYEFNLSSPSQVGELLFGHLKLDPKAKRTKKGAYSTTEEILEKYAHAHPIVGLILKIRRLRKLLATYINALPALINPATGKIHTSYNQTVTATGRLSSANPNLQNIPVRSDDGREIRRAFIADPGDLFLSADYSQIELRLMADMSGDETMVEAFRSGADIHQATAAKIYRERLEDVTDEQRRSAKTANFGIIYGISAFGLAERLGIARADAKALINGYFATYPGVKKYMDECIEKARQDGYVSTIMGRKRFLPEINSRNAVVRGYAERNAINAPLQGSAADIIKRAMIDIYRVMESEGLRSRMIMQVHDELIFNVKPDELDRVRQIVTEGMEGAYRGRVSLVVSSGVGLNWLEAH